MRKITAYARAAAVGLPVLFAASVAGAQSEPPTAEQLAAQIDALKQDYEKRIAALEAQLAGMKAKAPAAGRKAVPASKPSMKTGDNAFNPALGIVLNSMFSDFSEEKAAGIPGFQVGHHSERPGKGLALGHSEITASGNIDDKFRGNLTLGLGDHGNGTEIELEEAYIQTLGGSGMPDGVRLKAGRALWTFGYLNEQHAHGDDFTDRPLPYRAFLDGAYNDDGLELSAVLPGDLYTEIGGGVFRGDDAPFGGSESGREAWSAYARLGGDLGRNTAWRIGGYVLDGAAHERSAGAHDHGDEHAHDEDGHDEDDHGMEMNGHDDDHDEENGTHAGHEEHEHDEYFSEGAFTGDTRLFGVDFRLTWAPTGNARDSELILQGEYFRRSEEGMYELTERECTVSEHDIEKAQEDAEDAEIPVPCEPHSETCLCLRFIQR